MIFSLTQWWVDMSQATPLNVNNRVVLQFLVLCEQGFMQDNAHLPPSKPSCSLLRCN